jgi:MSHA biogenesis protein MshO
MRSSRTNNVSLLHDKCNRSQGFTLIEIIVVIVILSILAALGGKFVVESSLSYQATQARSLLVNTARQAVERMSRQLRIALPNSVRITNAGACVEFMAIASGGNYLGYVPDATNNANASSSISVSPHIIDFGTAEYVTIGANSASELYGAGALSREQLSARTSILLTLSAAKKWQRNSVAKRFYLLNAPQAFCVVGNQLRFYTAQDVTSSSVNIGSSYVLLADNISAATPFSLTAGSENRNVNILFAISFLSGSESILFNSSVMVRNVP